MELNTHNLLILALAVWRLSALLVYERGPFDVFVAIRKKAGIGHDNSGRPDMWPDRYFAKLLSCVWCLSVQIAIVVTILFAILGNLVIIVLMPFALSALAIALERVNNG